MGCKGDELIVMSYTFSAHHFIRVENLHGDPRNRVVGILYSYERNRVKGTLVLDISSLCSSIHCPSVLDFVPK